MLRNKFSPCKPDRVHKESKKVDRSHSTSIHHKPALPCISATVVYAIIVSKMDSKVSFFLVFLLVQGRRENLDKLWHL